MSEFPVELVEKELEDLATPNDIAVLASNKLLWRRHVVDIKAKLEADLQGKKADSMRSGFMNHQAMTKFQEFKKRAAHIKAMVDMRLSKLKIEIKEENRTKSRDVGELPFGTGSSASWRLS